MPHRQSVLALCQRHLPSWSGLSVSDFQFAGPGGFSSFTVAVRCRRAEVSPGGVFFRRLEGKENAILPFEAEKEVFLALGAAGIAAECLFYGPGYRLEAFYDGQSLSRHDLKDPETVRAIAARLHQLH